MKYSPNPREAGSALVTVMILMIIVLVLSMATLALSASETKSAAVAKMRTQALFVAEAGVELEIRALKELTEKSGFASPFATIDALNGTTPYQAQTLTKDGTSIGQFTVQVTNVDVIDAGTRDLTIRSEGFVPNAAAPNRVARTVTTTVRLKLGRSSVFDYVYFINNWGWFYANSIRAEGNVRANGQFDCGNYRPTINGVPRYNTVVGTDLQDRIDDGGMYAGWDILADKVEGKAKETWKQGDANAGRCTQQQVGTYKYQYSYQDQVKMPNLTNLGVYEQMAISQGSWIKVGNTVVSGPVMGDNAGEKQNLYLRGTAAQPIWVNGTVVVRGSVIISGVVKGKGQIYAGGNIYVPQNLTYKDGPQPLTDSGNETALENWLDHNQDKDMLGLFAREHVVVGDYTNSRWQSQVSSWLNNSQNKSKEDSGTDLLPNTRNGRDGIRGTADDDVLEDDNVWTVDRYTQGDADNGLIPAGKHVGDAIPETGEDIDGDGVYDGTTTVSQFTIPASLTSANWAGNVPSGNPSYSSISSMEVYLLDAAFYTNHAFAMVTEASNKHFELRGCIISRNESVIYGTQSWKMYYDYRLMGMGDQFGVYLPKTWQPIQVIVWTSN